MKVKFAIPFYVQKVARMLHSEGYKCYLVGGSLRDIVLKIKPDDYDLATDAKPEDMLKIFPKSISVGARFGMVSALVPDKNGEIFEVQVTTFRSEEEYVDGRWPSKVNFVDDIDKDLGRRDFTINAMALDLGSADLDGEEVEKVWDVHDPFDGETDLGLRVIRAVGTPLERFKEDGLRSFRACRLASQLGFDIETETFEAIRQTLTIAKMISMERVRDEFVKILLNSPKPSVGIELLRKSGLLEIFIPELIEGCGVEQKLFHANDVYEHLLKTLDMAPDNIKLAALFHDIGKPRTDMKNGHFYGHDTEGANMTEAIMTRLRFSRAEINRITNLVKNHMFFYPYESENMREEDRKRIQQKMWSDGAVRRFISRVGEENLEDLFALRIADAGSNPHSLFSPDEIQQLQMRISEVREKDMALKVTDLAVNGHDLKTIGLSGPDIGKTLSMLLEKVLDDPMLNEKETLLKLAKQV
jgi:poly(A) polymerase/tRNA nucleotidyltransferase (CCA-adding enzyme)